MEIKVFNELKEDAKYIRYKVFIEEQGFEHDYDDIDNNCSHVIIYENSLPVATCRYFFDDKRKNYIIGRVAVLKEYRNKKYGSILLKTVEEELIKKNVNIVELSSQLRAVDFYKKNGYVCLNQLHYDENCPHEWMQKKLDNSNKSN